MKIITDIVREKLTQYQLEFELLNEQNTGYAFPCSSSGFVDRNDLEIPEYEDYMNCLRGFHPVKLPPTVRKYIKTIQRPAVGICDVCHNEIELNSLRENQCVVCGAVYTIAAERVF